MHNERALAQNDTIFEPTITDVAPSPTTMRKLCCTVVPTLLLELGSNLNPEDIEEGDDVYFECKVHANPAAYKVIWKHNVSIICECYVWWNVSTLCGASRNYLVICTFRKEPTNTMYVYICMLYLYAIIHANV